MSHTSSRTGILIYSGHGPIVGGDAKYVFDLMQSLDPDLFNVTVCTDINPVFTSRVPPSLKGSDQIRYLDTCPAVSDKTIVDRVYEGARKWSDKSIVANQVFRTLDRIWGEYRVYEYLRRVWRALISAVTFRWVTNRISNALLFYRLFKEKRGELDVFHFNNGGYPAKEAGLIAIIVARFMNVKKIIMTFHNVPAYRRWYKPSGYIFDLLIPRFCTHIIATCETLRDELIRRRGFPPEKISTIYCGLADLEIPSPAAIDAARARLGVEAKSPLLIICANLDEPRKGHAVLFEALAKIRSLDSSFRLLVVGGGKPASEASLRDTVKQLRLEDHVLFLGYRNDATELNAVADIAVLPSVTFESIPYVVKEAACCGRPVITTTAGGCHEAVDHNVTGFVVPPGDVDSLAEAIALLITDGERRRRMGDAARSLFLQRFLLESRVRDVEAVYLQ